ncbi:hypothetical protein F5883DRAFT_652987 [Diaporthe sp. PMI_573]|nr:hypothetical protein F5883DRAFT_652987 [Diaporthaceae sp. PMI_573]
MPAQNDRWLRTSPNTQWQNLENQRFIDQAQLRSASLDGDRDTSDDEEEDFDSSEEMSDAEGRNNDSGGEISDEEDEADIKYNIESIPSHDRIKLCDYYAGVVDRIGRLRGGKADVKPRRWICESQVSILVSIVDLNGWTAYAFEDTYYKKHEPTSYWDSFCSKLGYYYPDALSSGTLDSTRFLEPRMYFLRVFETRIDQVYREWRVVVDMLAEIVKRHRPDRIFTQSAGYRSRWNSKRDKQILLQQRYSEWISIITIIVSDQSGQISTTLTAWEEFEKRCSKYFPEDPYSPLDTSIGHTFSMIKLLKDRLDGLSQEIARDQITLSAQLALENTGTAKFVKALTVISIVMMPMVLDIALFSIQPGVMPFQMDFLAFWDTLMLRGCFVLENLNSAFRPSSKTGNKPANGEEQASKMSGASADTDGDNSQMDGTSPQCHNPEMHAKAHHVADSSRSTPRTRGPDIQGPGVDAIRRQSESVSPQMTPQAAAAGLQYQAFDVQRAPWPQDQSSQIRIDAHNMSGEELSSQSLMGEIFAHVRTQWSSAESTEAQLDLLESLGKHKPKSVPEAAGIGSTWQGWLRCEWELPGVVQQLRESQSSEIQNLLRNVITITGGPGGMECSTCAEFLEKTWEESGLMALEVLSQGVALLEHGSTTSSRSTPSQTLEIRVTNTHIIIGVERDEQDAQSFVDAIVWICTAVRVNPQRQANSGERSQLQMSKASQLMSIKGVQPQVLVYGLADLTECSDQELGPQAKCWTGLFRSGIVAFHPCERSWGAGLEISFDMMIHLSGVENVYNIEGGVIFVGFSTALVPTSHDESTNSVQWHFEEVNGMSGELLRPCSLPSILGGWYKFQDVNILRTSKCFVGWYERANILLGTRQLVVDSHNRLDWSIDTKEHRQSVRMEGFEANGQLGFTAGPINTSLQLVSTWRFHSNVQHFCRHEQYSMALRLGCGNVAIIIDSESKQVWLVPMLSLILHLCHRYFQEINRNGQVDNPLPFADPSPDGASEAARVLERSGDVLVFGAEGDSDAENLRQLFLRINTNLLNAARTRESSNKRTLFASELMAMVTEPGRGSPLKKIRAAAAAESWVGLLARVDFVGVCANIGRLIEPDPPSTNPCICSALPSDRYLLAAHMRCLDALSQREGDKMRNSRNRVCRLGEKVFWNMGKLYWTRCPAAGHDPIWNEKDKILQQISSKEKGKGRDVQGVNGLTVPQQCLPEDGVVVFGGDPSKSLLQGLR